ncbi:MAG: T9SS type A sorting domain-containing protein, partial [Candidatus Cloacimonetes bacterium]|nr:T9SS type A sorting domain-containing protein [Candidatus Cloacimonadota bacterium]
YNNYPNPFNPETNICFTLSVEDSKAPICLEIFNIKGQKVKSLKAGRVSAGNHTFIWQGRNNLGKPVSSGVYFYRLRTASQTQMRKMLLMK